MSTQTVILNPGDVLTVQVPATVITPPPPPPPPVLVNPSQVTDLRVISATPNSITLGFTEVSGGNGLPANYYIRYAPTLLNWGSAAGEVPVLGSAIGNQRVVVVNGLTPSTSYQFQIVAYRGTPNVDAIFSSLSSIVSGVTSSVVVIPPPPPPPPPPPSTGGVLFSSDWSTGIKDSWDTYDEFRGSRTGDLMSVIPGGGPGGRNALKVLQHGEQAANLRKLNVITPGQDYYLRYYFRNDDSSSSDDHIVTCALYNYQSLIYMRRSGGASNWRHGVSLYGCGYTWPVGHWFLRSRLANGAWWRLEYFVHWTSLTSVQVHMRVYDAAGTLMYTDKDYIQSDYLNSPLWNGRNDWTFESYYAAGYSFCALPQHMVEFGLGNNGQAGATDTGLAWYFAGVEVRTDRWPGP